MHRGILAAPNAAPQLPNISKEIFIGAFRRLLLLSTQLNTSKLQPRFPHLPSVLGTLMCPNGQSYRAAMGAAG